MPRRHGLSKSRYTAGLQCHKQLWWRVHEPDAPELVPDAGTQKLFDTGLHVGEVARTHVPGGVLIDLPHTDYEGKAAETQRAIEPVLRPSTKHRSPPARCSWRSTSLSANRQAGA